MNAKSDKSAKLESLARDGFLAAEIPEALIGWQDSVIADIRRQHAATEQNREIPFQLLLPPRLTWRFAAAAIILAAVLCLSFYLTAPANGNDEYFDEVSVDCYDNYIEIAARL